MILQQENNKQYLRMIKNSRPIYNIIFLFLKLHEYTCIYIYIYIYIYTYNTVEIMLCIRYIDGNASKPHIMIFEENEIFRKYVFDSILYKVSMTCTKIRMQSLPKWQK